MTEAPRVAFSRCRPPPGRRAFAEEAVLDFGRAPSPSRTRRSLVLVEEELPISSSHPQRAKCAAVYVETTEALHVHPQDWQHAPPPKARPHRRTARRRETGLARAKASGRRAFRRTGQSFRRSCEGAFVDRAKAFVDRANAFVDRANAFIESCNRFRRSCEGVRRAGQNRSSIVPAPPGRSCEGVRRGLPRRSIVPRRWARLPSAIVDRLARRWARAAKAVVDRAKAMVAPAKATVDRAKAMGAPAKAVVDRAKAMGAPARRWARLPTIVDRAKAMGAPAKAFARSTNALARSTIAFA